MCVIYAKKTFPFKSQLNAHLKVHRLKQKKVCGNCNKYFAWEKSFLKHKEICHDNTEPFLPSMVQTVLLADSMNNEEPDITVEEPDIIVEVPNIVAVPDIITEKQDSIEKVPNIIVGELSVKQSSISSVPVVTTPKFDVNVYRQASKTTRKSLETIVNDLVAMKSPVKNKVANN